MNTIFCASILAAGGSTRFGSQKMLHPIDGVPLLQHVINHVIRSVEGVPGVKWHLELVLGCDSEQIQRRVHAGNLSISLNRSWKKGFSTSVKRAVSTALSFQPSGLFLFLGDMPYLVESDTIQVIEAAITAQNSIIRPTYEGAPGFPVYLPKRLFPEILRLQGDEGAKQVIERHHHLLRSIPTRTIACTRDLDHPESPG